ncbi:F-box only protein 39 isoform X1 [Penaeus vannamei]|uniref:F-box only protein 39 isoform X1 n=1 Tax=Penaeus vannamei TaxID=6689 RepID=UPI00387F4611
MLAQNLRVIKLQSGEKLIFEDRSSVLSSCRPVAARPEDDPEHKYSEWHLLPDLLLEQVFQYLTLCERYNASLVCSNWYAAFYFPRVWYTFVFHDELLTKRKFNYYSGYQKRLDHYKVTIFLSNMGKFIKTLIIKPMTNFFSLYEFCNMSCFMNHKVPGTLDNVHTFRFHFSCHLAQRSEEVVFGTGGEILQMFKRLLGILTKLKTLELRDLLLEGADGLQLLDDVCVECCETLQTLILVNITKHSHCLLHPGAFVNLQTLVISPQNIGEDLLELLSHTTVRNMFIVQNKYTENGRILDPLAWKRCRKTNPRLRVHLSSEGNSKKEILWQRRAPVKSIVYESPYAKITTSVMMQLVELYHSDLEVFAHKQLPRFHMPRSFHDRADSSLILLARQCPYLHTLVVREKISTATVLLLVYTAKNLQFLYVRRNAILLKADWPMNPDWTFEFYDWLRRSARSYEAMEREVSQMLGHRWQALTDKQYKNLQLDLEKSRYMYF